MNYHSDMLVANITMGNIVIPLDFEMIENEIVGASKQDCETKATKRMLARIKRNYKRLPICFSGDGLYFSEPILNICKEYNWKYIITYKEGCASSVEEYYQVAKRYNDVTKYRMEKNREIEQKYEFYNGIEYRGNKVNMVKMEEISKESSTTFCYVSNFNITIKNVAGLVQHGRNRWKIENKSFNDMKNHGYHLTHAFSYNSNAIQGHFVILMMACLMMQLLEYKERVKNRFTTIRKMGMEIKEALRNTVLSAKDIREIFQATQFRRSISYL